MLKDILATDDRRDSDGRLPYATRYFMPIKHLVGLRSIVLFGLDDCGIEEEVVAEVLGSLPQLRSLELARFTIDSFPALCSIVTSCPRLERLYLADIVERGVHSSRSMYLKMLKAQSEGTDVPPPFPALQLFSVTHCRFTDRLLVWIAEGSRASQPGSVFIGCDDAHLYQGKVGHFLRTAGPALKRLCIEQRPWKAEEGASELPIFVSTMDLTLMVGVSVDHPFYTYLIHLRENIGIEVLTFSRCTGLTLTRETLALLDEFTGTQLRELNISFKKSLDDLEDVLSFHRARLQDLDTLLQGPNFASLEAVTFGLPEGCPASLHTMKEFFPLTAARGLVRVMNIVAMEQSVTRGNGTVEVTEQM